MQPRVNLNDYSSFTVQSKAGDRWSIGDPIADHVPFEVAEARALQLATDGSVEAARIWGHHRTARGGFGDRIVWDSRDVAITDEPDWLLPCGHLESETPCDCPAQE